MKFWIALTVGWGMCGVVGTAALAQPVQLTPQTQARLAADLAYPNGSQRFFAAGRARMEQEIQRLSQPQESPSLTIQPELLEQMDDQDRS